MSGRGSPGFPDFGSDILPEPKSGCGGTSDEIIPKENGRLSESQWIDTQKPLCYSTRMKLSKTRIDVLSVRLIEALLNQNLIETEEKKEIVASRVAMVITKELEVEDRLNREVEEMMEKYAREMRGEKIDPRAMFQMIKKQLVKERNIIL